MPRRKARILERSYSSPVDGAREPYTVYLPRRYAGGECPLLVWLHGFGSRAGASGGSSGRRLSARCSAARRWAGRARSVSRMDVELSRRRARLYRRRWSGAALGLRMIHPNPLAPGRYVMICYGDMGESRKQMETLGWYWPDWVVFDERAECRRTVHSDWPLFDDALARGDLDTLDPLDMPLRYLPDKWLDAGFFDASWRLP